MSKWLITTNQPKVVGKEEICSPTSKVHEFVNEDPSEKEILSVINTRGAILYMHRLDD